MPKLIPNFASFMIRLCCNDGVPPLTVPSDGEDAVATSPLL